MKTQDTTETLATIAVNLGVTIETSAPRGEVEPAQSKDSKPWPNVAYNVTLKRNGKPVWTGPFKLGLGYVDPSKAQSFCWHSPEEAMLNAWKRKSCADFVDKELHATVAAKLAQAQKVTPKLDDVLNSLLSDGSAYFDAQSFEEWACESGYDSDSRKAETIWKACDEIGRKLARAFTAQELEELREAACNH